MSHPADAISPEGKAALTDLLNLNVKQASDYEALRQRHNSLVERNQNLEKQVAELGANLSKQASAKPETPSIPALDDDRIALAVEQLVDAGIMVPEKKAACQRDIKADPNLAVNLLIKVAAFVQPQLQAQGVAVSQTHLPERSRIGQSSSTPWYS